MRRRIRTSIRQMKNLHLEASMMYVENMRRKA